MAFVLDSSVTIAWCFEDEEDEYAVTVGARLENEEAVAPMIWPYEVSNVLLFAEKHGRIAAAAGAEFLDLLASQPITVDPTPPGTALIVLARQYGLTAYDAAYLELALRKGLPLATLDARLRQAATDAGAALA